MIDEQKAMREEISELRGQVIAWQKQCDTLTHQVICCGVAASHPDATLTTRGAYAGKWNSSQAEEVRKLRSECDQMRSERTALLVNEQNLLGELAALRASLVEPVAWAVYWGEGYKRKHSVYFDFETAKQVDSEISSFLTEVRPLYALSNKETP